MKVPKNIKTFINYFLGTVLFVWLSWSIYNQIKFAKQDSEILAIYKGGFLKPVGIFIDWHFLLMFVHWGIEAFKWQLAIKKEYKGQFFNSI